MTSTPYISVKRLHWYAVEFNPPPGIKKGSLPRTFHQTKLSRRIIKAPSDVFLRGVGEGRADYLDIDGGVSDGASDYTYCYRSWRAKICAGPPPNKEDRLRPVFKNFLRLSWRSTDGSKLQVNKHNQQSNAPSDGTCGCDDFLRSQRVNPCVFLALKQKLFRRRGAKHPLPGVISVGIYSKAKVYRGPADCSLAASECRGSIRLNTRRYSSQTRAVATCGGGANHHSAKPRWSSYE